MRKRPQPLSPKAEEFINRASANLGDSGNTTEDLHKYVRRPQKWPLDERVPSPSLDEGSNLKRPMLINFSEKEWNSVTRHTNALGVPKTEWIKHAVYKLMEEEQIQFFNRQL